MDGSCVTPVSPRTSPRHARLVKLLRDGALVLFDLSASWFEGSCRPLAKRGCRRDDRAGPLQVNDGLLTDARGCPVAAWVFEGDAAGSQIFLPAAQRVHERFVLARVVMIGDRGMVLHKAIDDLRGQRRRGLDHRVRERVHPLPCRARPLGVRSASLTSIARG